MIDDTNENFREFMSNAMSALHHVEANSDDMALSVQVADVWAKMAIAEALAQLK